MKTDAKTIPAQTNSKQSALLCFWTAAGMLLVAGWGYLGEQLGGWCEHLWSLSFVACGYLLAGGMYWLKGHFETRCVSNSSQMFRSPGGRESGSLSLRDALPPVCKLIAPERLQSRDEISSSEEISVTVSTAGPTLSRPYRAEPENSRQRIPSL